MIKHLFCIVILGATAIACTEKSAVIEGQFFGEEQKTIFLEKLSPMGGSVVDSAKTDSKGNFKFIIQEKLDVPTFYNVNLGNSYVPLLLENGESVEISSMANIFFNYTVEGSKGSSLIKEFNMLVRNTTLKMDSLVNVFETTTDNDLAQLIGKEYEQAYVNFKRNAIVFITKNSASLASLLPLYKPYNTDGQFLFDQPSDYLYFVMLSDSLSSRYPNSDYVVSLKNDVDMLRSKQENLVKMDSIIKSSVDKTVGYVDLKMTDAQGKIRKLSDLNGKTILLSFTASQPAELKTINAELKDVYVKFSGRGLEIFQVSLDQNKSMWLNTVSSQRLPWISVNDFGGQQSNAVAVYNITKIPTNILIDKNGNIVTMDVNIDNLEKALLEII